MDYNQALQYLSSLVDREKKNSIKYKRSLDSFREYLKAFGQPHKKLKGFLIGGTKGKGSTAHIIESICRCSGFRTGLFTSPHLISYRERIKIDGKPITEVKFASLVEEISGKNPDMSVFETLTMMAFLLFSREKVDYSIFEVGLGGRLDATNVFEPDISIITSISFDHTEILGETLEEISKEKADILRKEKFNISAPQTEEVERILKEKVRGNIEFVRNFKLNSLDDNRTVFNLDGEEFNLGLVGGAQALNASLAITACRKIGINLRLKEFNRTLSKLKIPGRFQIIKRNPHLILDGAHNVASMKALRETLKEVFGRKVRMVFSCLSDKNVKGMLSEIKPVVEKIYPTSIPCDRKMPLSEIKVAGRETGIKMAETTGLPARDVKKALRDATTSDIVIVTGSFYLLGEILRDSKIWNS